MRVEDGCLEVSWDGAVELLGDDAVDRLVAEAIDSTGDFEPMGDGTWGWRALWWRSELLERDDTARRCLDEAILTFDGGENAHGATSVRALALDLVREALEREGWAEDLRNGSLRAAARYLEDALLWACMGATGAEDAEAAPGLREMCLDAVAEAAPVLLLGEEEVLSSNRCVLVARAPGMTGAERRAMEATHDRPDVGRERDEELDPTALVAAFEALGARNVCQGIDDHGCCDPCALFDLTCAEAADAAMEGRVPDGTRCQVAFCSPWRAPDYDSLLPHAGLPLGTCDLSGWSFEVPERNDELYGDTMGARFSDTVAPEDRDAAELLSLCDTVGEAAAVLRFVQEEPDGPYAAVLDAVKAGVAMEDALGPAARWDHADTHR